MPKPHGTGGGARSNVKGRPGGHMGGAARKVDVLGNGTDCTEFPFKVTRWKGNSPDGHLRGDRAGSRGVSHE